MATQYQDDKGVPQHIVHHSEHAAGELTDEDHVVEKKLLLKLDCLILPLTALLYLSAFLDRGNIGNAKLQGLIDILGPKETQDTRFAVALSSFYITYIVLNVPGNILVSVIQPNYALALGALTWGIASSAMAGANNYAGVIVCRLFIGVGEAAFGAAVPLYYGLWYRRNEIAVRLSFYIGAGSLAGAFGGLIAYGVSFIHSHIATWRILFLIEGLPTLLLAALIVVLLPSTPEKSRFIKDNERVIIRRRLYDTGVSHAHTFDKSAFRAAFTRHTTYLNALIYMGLNLSLGSVSGFLPTIIKSFGYTNSRAQLFTVPPYAVAFVGTITFSFLSDRFRTRGPFVVTLMLLSAIGFAILIGVPHNNHARYFATFLVVLGAFSNIPLMLSWAANTAGSNSASAVRLGFMNSIGQCFSILASFVFPAAEGPKWHKGFALNLTFNGIAAITALYLTIYYRRENKRRDVAEAELGDVHHDEYDEKNNGELAEVPANLHDKAPGFRYYT